MIELFAKSSLMGPQSIDILNKLLNTIPALQLETVSFIYCLCTISVKRII